MNRSKKSYSVAKQNVLGYFSSQAEETLNISSQHKKRQPDANDNLVQLERDVETRRFSVTLLDGVTHEAVAAEAELFRVGSGVTRRHKEPDQRGVEPVGTRCNSGQPSEQLLLVSSRFFSVVKISSK